MPNDMLAPPVDFYWGDFKRVAIFQIRSMRFKSLFCRMSLSQNR